MKRSHSSSPSEREAIEATAAAWLAQRDDGLSPAEETEFARWRATDARHEAAVARLEKSWAVLQRLRDFRPEARMHPDRDLLADARRPRKVIPFPAIATAALAACLALAAVWWFGGKSRAFSDEQRYATGADGFQRVALADGSLMELNSQTEVAVRFTAAERRVQLVQGEAHFTVAKNPARPFAVEARTIAVRAVGTAFSVRLGSSDVEVLVTEGRVEVAQPAPAVRSSRGNEPGASSGLVTLSATPLIAGQRAVVPVDRAAAPPVVENLLPQAVRQALAWQGPRLVFLDTPLAEAVARFNQHNRVQLELADDELRSLPVGGSFRADNVEALVRLLTDDRTIVADNIAPDRIVLRKAK